MNHRSGATPDTSSFAASLSFKVIQQSLTLGCIFLPLLACPADTNSGPSDLTELSLESLMEIEVPKVYGASKLEQKTTEAPSSITVITADEFKRYGHRTLADVLQSVQGFHVSNDRNYAFLGARGVNLGDFNSRILLLVNGHRINNNLTDGAYIDTAALLDLDLIDRIEVIRGPGSVLYGNNAFFGVINIITRNGAQLNGVETSGEYASFNTSKGRVSYGKTFTNGLQVLLSGSLYRSDGEKDLFYKEFNTPAQNNGIAHELDEDEFHSAFGSVSYRGLTLEGGYLRREKGNPTAQYGTTFNDPRLRTIDERGYANLKYSHKFENLFDMTAQVYYDRNEFAIGYPLSLQIGTNVFDLSSTEKSTGEWWGGELQLNKRLWDRHLVTLGGEFRDDFRQERQVAGQPLVSQRRQSHGIYSQGDFELAAGLHLNAGVRYDHYDDVDPTYNPRVGLIYHPAEQSTFKALYGTAFRAPNFLELSNPQFQNISPEEITSYELVYEQKIGRNLRSSISGFYNEMNELIVFDSGTFKNFDAETKGLELALEGFWTNGIRGRVSYALQDTKNDTVSWDLPDSPHHLIKFNLSLPVYEDKLFAGVEFQFTSSRRSLHNTVDTLNQPLTVQGEKSSGFGIVNLTLFSQNLIEGLELSVSLYNVLNERYADPASRFHQQDTLERAGRTFRLKTTYRF